MGLIHDGGWNMPGAKMNNKNVTKAPINTEPGLVLMAKFLRKRLMDRSINSAKDERPDTWTKARSKRFRGCKNRNN